MRKICSVKMKNCEDEIDDVISESYLALCEHTKKHGLPSNPTAWLYSVLYRRINNKFREIYKQTKNTAELDEAQTLPFEIDFDEEMLKSIPIDKLKNKLLSQLTKQELELYELIYIEKESYSKIAKHYSTSQGAVKQRHYRLCNKIKKSAKNLLLEQNALTAENMR